MRKASVAAMYVLLRGDATDGDVEDDEDDAVDESASASSTLGRLRT